MFYLHWVLGRWGTGLDAFAPEALAEYERCFKDPAMIHASCEDYRAAASIDLAHDEADLERRIRARCWRSGAARADGAPLRRARHLARAERRPGQRLRPRCGHFLAEERPEETAEALGAFFRG